MMMMMMMMMMISGTREGCFVSNAEMWQTVNQSSLQKQLLKWQY